MIIIAYKPGQLANRLFLFARFLAYSYEHNVHVINPSFDDYAGYFSKTKRQVIPFSGGSLGYAYRPIIHFVFHLSYYLGRSLHKMRIHAKLISITYLNWSEQYDLDTDKKLMRVGLHFIQGWGFMAQNLLSLHRPKVIDFFHPEEELQNRIDLFSKKFEGLPLVVGVHIRQGDYQYFESGKYFYELNSYISIMKRLAERYQQIHFLVCTNNKAISLADFEKMDVTIAPGHELIDLWLLAKCNYIMGPPSTYSLWASFYGNVPLYQIKDINKNFDWDSFELAN